MSNLKINASNIFICCFFLISAEVFSQNGILKGKITSVKEVIPYATVSVKGKEQFGTSANAEGKFVLELAKGIYELKISAVGYLAFTKEIEILEGEEVFVNALMKADILGLEQVVVTGARGEVPTYKTPVIISKVTSKLMESTQSLSVSEGLNFSTGLRMETNCQNCGFTQLRINGLEGAYSQILINSRPVFSALAGVYGLDMIPANMVDRIEVMKGGGSVLYGGNAIGGTVNIITKDPVENTIQLGGNYSFIDGKLPDRTLFANGSIVSEDLNKGFNFYAYNRYRQPFDANGDGFSEMTKLRNTTFGADFFMNTSKNTRLDASFSNISEFRRGGNKFELQPHETDITEQLKHNVLGGDLSFEINSNDEKHQVTLFASARNTDRDSYYGGGGIKAKEIKDIQDEEAYFTALNSYGKSYDISAIGGGKYKYDVNDKMNILLGTEYQKNRVEDEMKGYNRSINQSVGAWGNYVQLELKFNPITLQLGGRYDYTQINGKYNFNGVLKNTKGSYNNFVPRITTKYDISEKWKLRASYAQGYRLPQAFDEDLHIETVGGAARFTKLAADLKPEKSDNITASLNYVNMLGDWQANIVAEGFYTNLHDAFITSDPKELKDGSEASVVEKRNGSGAVVAGVNLEINFAYLDKFILQMGTTVQSSKYKKEEQIWSPEEGDSNEAVTTKAILRTPNQYGFLSATYNFTENMSLSYSAALTGTMMAPHITNPDTEYTEIVKTPVFFENNLKGSYKYETSDHYFITFSAGVQNIFNSYQDDFDKGGDRDAGYIYGPVRPRTFFVGVKFGID